jgi:hypothetical protein
MNRQKAGLLLILAVLVGVAIAAGPRPYAVPGTAIAVPVGGPPAVGDCSDTRQVIGACHGPRSGEVVAVLADSAVPSPTRITAPIWVQNACTTAALTYLGTPRAPPFVFWHPRITTSVTYILPSARQITAGQHWLACLIRMESAGTRSLQYQNSLRRALLTGANRDRLGLCIPVTKWQTGTVPGACTVAHELQILAVGDTGAYAAKRNDLVRSCHQAVLQLTGMSDPVGHGDLVDGLQASGPDGAPIDGADIPARSKVQCQIAGRNGRLLDGSLLALGKAPIPWAP